MNTIAKLTLTANTRAQSTPSTASRQQRGRRAARSARGQGVVEVLLVSTLFLIPVGLLFLDGITLVAAVAANNSLCKAGARAAGNQPNSGSARRALDQVIARFPKSQIISNVTLSEFAYYDPASYVDVKTTMTVVLPAQLPGLPEQLTVTASSRQSNTAVRARFRA